LKNVDQNHPLATTANQLKASFFPWNLSSLICILCFANIIFLFYFLYRILLVLLRKQHRENCLLHLIKPVRKPLSPMTYVIASMMKSLRVVNPQQAMMLHALVM